MMKNYKLLLIYALVAIMAIGCSKDNNKGGKKGPVDLGDDVILTFDMTVPAAGSAATYAISGEDEHFVDNLTAVLFEEVAGEEYYRYHTHATTIENGTTNAKRFRIQVKKSTTVEKYRIVALANLPADHVSDIVAGLQDPKILKKEDFLKEINFKSLGKWNTTSSSDFTPLPMWGETPAMQPITTSLTPDQLGTIRLLRSIARVDIGMDMVSSAGNVISQGLPNFKLEAVKIYNASNSGAIAPLVANLSNTPGELKAQKPTLPAGVAINTPAIDYTKASVADWDEGFIRDIYIAESDVKNAATAQTRTCVILKGYYTAEGDPTNISVPTWYRIDFFKKGLAGNPKIEYLDILRNCRYHVNITKVSGPGYDTETEAVNSLPINLDADVEVWDEYQGMDDITTDGQYHLVVNKNSFEYFKEGRERILEIYADHPSGWKVLAADLPAWIHLTPQDYDGQTLGPMTGKMNVSITLDPIDPSNTNQFYTREDYFTITSGVMKKKIYIKQINQPELTIDVFPNTLIFRKSGSSAKPIQVTVYPASSVVHFSEISGIHPISWRLGGFPITGLANLGSYSFQPAVNNSTDLLSATITIYIQSTDGTMASKTVAISQLATDMLFTITNKPMTYPAVGGPALSFTVESDAPWQLSTDMASDPNQMLTLSNLIEQPGTTPGTVPYLFGLTPNPLYDTERIANIYAKSSDKDFPQQMIEIKQAAQAPTLKLNDLAANAIVDFGTPTDNTIQRTVKVTTNSGWVSILNANHARVTSDWSPTFDLVQAGSTVPTQELDGSIIIKSQSSIIGMPAAGTEVSENFAIETRNHGTAPAVSRTLTVKRTIRPFWEYDAITPATGTVLAHAGQAVTVTANTNMKWSVGSNVTTTIASAATPYAVGKPQSINIPLNNSWVNPRTVTVSSIQDGEALVNRATYKQPGYTLEYVSHTFGNPLPAAGKSGTFTFKTTSSNPATANHRIRAWYDVTKIYVGSASIPAQTTPSNAFSTASFTIAANNTFASRTLNMHMNREGTAPPNKGIGGPEGWLGWANQVNLIQSARTMSGVVAAGTIPSTGGNWGVTMTTDYVGTYHIRAMVGATQVGINTTASGGGLKYVSVGAHTVATSRTVTFQYREGAAGAWRDIAGSGRTQMGRINLGNGWWTTAGKTIQMTGAVASVWGPANASGPVADTHCTNAHGAGWKSVFAAIWSEKTTEPVYAVPSYGAAYTGTDKTKTFVGTINYMNRRVTTTPYGNFIHGTWTFDDGTRGTNSNWSTFSTQLFTITCASK